MAPNIGKTEVLHICKVNTHLEDKPKDREYKLVWRNIILYIVLHTSALYGIYLLLTSAKILTAVYGKRKYMCIAYIPF